MDTELEYKIVSEYAAPTYYDYETNDELMDTSDVTLQGYWVVSWDKEEKEIYEWIERFDDVNDAKRYRAELEGIQID